jgi:DNA-directed RNA polymerase subunit RPC12/RpoP
MEISEVKHRMPGHKCSNCGSKLDGASGIDHRHAPEPGNLSVCGYCGHLRAYAEDLSLRELTSEEMRDVMRDPELSGQILRLRRAIRAAQKVRT